MNKYTNDDKPLSAAKARMKPKKKTPTVKVQDEDYFFHVDKTDEREVLQSFSDSFKGTVGYREGWDL